MMTQTDLERLHNSSSSAARRQLAAELLAASTTDTQPNAQHADTHLQTEAEHHSDTQALEAATPERPHDHTDLTTSEATPPEAVATTSTTTTNHAAANAPPTDVAMRSDGCSNDLESFCKREANILAVLEDVPSGIDAASIAHAIKSVQLCMARNIESLSSACIDALVADMVKQKRDALTPAAFESVPANDAYPQQRAPDEDSSVEVSIHYSKHHNSAGLRGAGHAALAPAIGQTVPTASAAAGDSELGSPLLWLLVFPFFCVGLYTAYNHALVYMRRRRDIFRVESKQYTPLP